MGDWRTVDDKDLLRLSGDRYGAVDRLEQQSRGQASGPGRRSLYKAADAATAPQSSASPAGGPALAGSLSAKRKESGAGSGGAGGGEAALVEAEVRKKFADTAVWLTTLNTGTSGEATASFEMPDNLTTWKINAWAMTKATRVGQADTAAVTTKNLLVRLQAPRFFMEYDEVVVSANVHNYLETEKTARAR